MIDFMKPFKWLWSFINSDKAKAAFQRIDAMIKEAMPIVEEIASLTPTRSDDEIIALFEKYALPFDTQAEAWLALPVDQRGKALLYAGEQELAKQFPATPLNEISSAVSLAVSLLKSK